MHYKLGRGVIVKTENAAKPISQPSSCLNELLSSLPHVSTAFDYGCGKLRYKSAILKRSDELAVVDSEIQLSRLQILDKTRSSIREIARNSNRITVLNDVEFETSRRRFERGFCINVLSVIPIPAVRRKVLRTIRSHLNRSASCLFVVQYRNSDFDRMQRLTNAKRFRDGFLIDSRRGYSFYGLISPERLVSMLTNEGLVVKSMKLNEGSAYVWAGRE